MDQGSPPGSFFSPEGSLARRSGVVGAAGVQPLHGIGRGATPAASSRSMRHPSTRLLLSNPRCFCRFLTPSFTTNRPEHVHKDHSLPCGSNPSPEYSHGIRKGGCAPRCCTDEDEDEDGRVVLLAHVRRVPTSRTKMALSRGMQAVRKRGLLLARTFSAPAIADAVEVTVDGKPVRVPKGASVMEACDAAGVDIPRFCYHQRLSVAGNCRMCLVEVRMASPNRCETELRKRR